MMFSNKCLVTCMAERCTAQWVAVGLGLPRCKAVLAPAECQQHVLTELPRRMPLLASCFMHKYLHTTLACAAVCLAEL